MSEPWLKSEDISGRVRDMFLIAERDHDLTMRRLAALTGIKYDSIKYWRNGGTMPLWAFVALLPHIPDELASLITEPANRSVVGDEMPEGGPHDLAGDSGEYVSEFAKAIHPAGPGGPNITHIERARLVSIHRRMKCRRVA
jgi:hypothetical protein